jgi:2-polyprenyl-3-methyl-5-hydroxy-6-metoxy-1,4-benzoquinol methylase
MQYDPIKKSLGNVFNRTPFLRVMFYKLLDILLLRTWYVKKEIRKWAREENRSVTILDAGSGFGQYSFFISGMNKNWIIHSVDVKEEQIRDCTDFFTRMKKKNVSFEIADLTTFVKSNTYDLILSVDVMEHILEDVEVFRNFYNSLTKNGMVLISTPSDQGGSDVHDHAEEESFIDEHVRDGYNIVEIQEKLRSAGLKLSMKYPIMMLNASRFCFILLPFYYLLLFWVALICNFTDLWTKHKSGTGLIVKAWK